MTAENLTLNDRIMKMTFAYPQEPLAMFEQKMAGWNYILQMCMPSL